MANDNDDDDALRRAGKTLKQIHYADATNWNGPSRAHWQMEMASATRHAPDWPRVERETRKNRPPRLRPPTQIGAHPLGREKTQIPTPLRSLNDWRRHSTPPFGLLGQMAGNRLAVWSLARLPIRLACASPLSLLCRNCARHQTIRSSANHANGRPILRPPNLNRNRTRRPSFAKPLIRPTLRRLDRTHWAQMSTVSEREIKKWHKGFRKDCPNGQLTEPGFLRIYKQFFPHGDPTKFARACFRVFDQNHVSSPAPHLNSVRPIQPT